MEVSELGQQRSRSCRYGVCLGGEKRNKNTWGFICLLGMFIYQHHRLYRAMILTGKKKHIKIKKNRMNVLCSAVVTVAIVHVGGWEVNKKVSSIARKFRVNGEINLI